MKYLTILIKPFKLKGDPDDRETVKSDLYEKLQVMIDAETLKFEIQDEFEDEEDESELNFD